MEAGTSTHSLSLLSRPTGVRNCKIAEGLELREGGEGRRRWTWTRLLFQIVGPPPNLSSPASLSDAQISQNFLKSSLLRNRQETPEIQKQDQTSSWGMA